MNNSGRFKQMRVLWILFLFGKKNQNCTIIKIYKFIAHYFCCKKWNMQGVSSQNSYTGSLYRFFTISISTTHRGHQKNIWRFSFPIFCFCCVFFCLYFDETVDSARRNCVWNWETRSVEVYSKGSRHDNTLSIFSFRSFDSMKERNI